MASLGDVGDVLRLVLDKIDQSIAAHHRAADLAGEARELLAAAGIGTASADVEQVCELFTRVVEGITEPEGQVSVLATAGGRQLPPMSSGWDPVWSAAVQRRAAEVGFNGSFLAVHVEMKIAAMMIDTKTAAGELTINYTPCGVEQLRWRPDVHGTTQDNQPFAYTYRGRG